MSVELEPERLDRFAKLLAKSNSQRVGDEALWAAFAESFPAFAAAADRRRWFLAALKRLEVEGKVQLPPPKGARWDRKFDVAVPTSVRLIREESPPAANAWRTFPWHSRLEWVARLSRLAPEYEQLLLNVHRGLVHGTFAKRAPLKYRSLQLTGREKRLEELARSSLFDVGRLDWELLGCYPETPPVTLEVVGSGASLVIFENADSFAVARDVLKSLRNSPYGVVGYGAGNGIWRSLPYLKTIERQFERIDYVGDLDFYGIKIAMSVATKAAKLALPTVFPATRLHRAMLDSAAKFGRADGWSEDEATRKLRRTGIDAVVGFLHESVREPVRTILENRRRIPEEVLGPDELAAAWNG